MNVQTVKRCFRCKRIKPFSDFYIYHGKPSSKCRPCHLEYSKQWRTNAGASREYTRRYEAARNEANRALIEAHKEEYSALLIAARKKHKVDELLKKKPACSKHTRTRKTCNTIQALPVARCSRRYGRFPDITLCNKPVLGKQRVYCSVRCNDAESKRRRREAKKLEL